MSEKLSRSDLIDLVAEAANKSKKDVKAILEIAFETVTQAVLKGNTIQIADFGTFKPKDTNARSGVMSTTGKEWHTPAMRQIGFSPSPRGKMERK